MKIPSITEVIIMFVLAIILVISMAVVILNSRTDKVEDRVNTVENIII